MINDEPPDEPLPKKLCEFICVRMHQYVPKTTINSPHPPRMNATRRPCSLLQLISFFPLSQDKTSYVQPCGV